MEFNEKLQNLRKKHNLTQEQLAAKLHISRTAVSKWESGRGFPNIEALKNISRQFNVPIDQLLSGEELLDIAENDNRARRFTLISLLFGIYDIILISLIFIPLYGEQIGDYVRTVNLLQWAADTWVKTSYFIVLITICVFGIVEILLHFFKKEKIHRALRTVSLILHSLAVLVFISTREPYVATFLFLFLLLKVVLLVRKT